MFSKLKANLKQTLHKSRKESGVFLLQTRVPGGTPLFFSSVTPHVPMFRTGPKAGSLSDNWPDFMSSHPGLRLNSQQIRPCNENAAFLIDFPDSTYSPAAAVVEVLVTTFLVVLRLPVTCLGILTPTQHGKLHDCVNRTPSLAACSIWFGVNAAWLYDVNR